MTDPNPDTWPQLLAHHAQTPLAELVDGFTDITELPVPYAQLPRRVHTAFAGTFTRWADFAPHSLHTLLSLPGVGDANARDILTAATKAAAAHQAAISSNERPSADAAVGQLLDALPARDRIILAARLWAAEPEPPAVLDERLGVYHGWVGRYQRRSTAKFTELLATPAHQAVTDYAHHLGHQIGPYAPAPVVTAALTTLHVDPSSETARVLLYLAGPYTRLGDWFENPGGSDRAAAAIDTAFAVQPAPHFAALLDALRAIGMAPQSAQSYLHNQLDARRFGDQFVRWGEAIADKIEAALHVLNAPATVDEILATVGHDETPRRAVHGALIRHPRFVRTSRRSWGLHTWGHHEYKGIVDEIRIRIDAAGGRINLTELITDIRATFPDIAETSIRTYVSTLAFITEAGTVRRRRRTDPWPVLAPVNTVRGAFLSADTHLRLAVPVTSDVMRGSSQHFKTAVAAALGILPGHIRVMTGPHGAITLNWPLTSTTGVRTSSLRPHVQATGARLGDTLVLIFSLDDNSVDVELIRSTLPEHQRLQKLVGPIRLTVNTLAASLECKPAEVTTVLRARGDEDLADIVEHLPPRHRVTGPRQRQGRSS
ncbi:hypothetical protein [Mycobacterium servetii]|uniref:DNA-binding protein n=1 Tax=Mycobacterium servetii TaxID=3237418 RepID=A0ABV4C8X2_9MYCO